MPEERSQDAVKFQYAQAADIPPSDYEQNEPLRKRFAGFVKLAGAVLLTAAAVVGIALFFTALSLAGPPLILFGIIAAVVAACALALAGFIAFLGSRDIKEANEQLKEVQAELRSFPDGAERHSPGEKQIDAHSTKASSRPDLAQGTAAPNTPPGVGPHPGDHSTGG